MDKYEEEFIKICEGLIKKETYRYVDLSPDLLDYIYRILNDESQVISGSNDPYSGSLFWYDLNLVNFFDVTGEDYDKHFRTDVYKYGSYYDANLKDNTLSTVDKKSIIINTLTRKGHEIYDSLKFKEREESLINIQEKQIVLQAEINDSNKKTTDLLHNTFLIYLLMGVVMFFQLFGSFIDSQLKINTYSTTVYVLLVMIALYFGIGIIWQLKKPDIKWTLYLGLALFLVIGLILYIVVMYNYGKLEIKEATSKDNSLLNNVSNIKYECPEQNSTNETNGIKAILNNSVINNSCKECRNNNLIWHDFLNNSCFLPSLLK